MAENAGAFEHIEDGEFAVAGAGSYDFTVAGTIDDDVGGVVVGPGEGTFSVASVLIVLSNVNFVIFTIGVSEGVTVGADVAGRESAVGDDHAVSTDNIGIAGAGVGKFAFVVGGVVFNLGIETRHVVTAAGITARTLHVRNGNENHEEDETGDGENEHNLDDGETLFYRN